MAADRDEKGRLKKGSVIRSAGTPWSKHRRILMGVMEQELSRDHMAKVVRSLIIAAVGRPPRFNDKGELEHPGVKACPTSATVLLQYGLGKPKTYTDPLVHEKVLAKLDLGTAEGVKEAMKEALRETMKGGAATDDIRETFGALQTMNDAINVAELKKQVAEIEERLKKSEA